MKRLLIAWIISVNCFHYSHMSQITTNDFKQLITPQCTFPSGENVRESTNETCCRDTVKDFLMNWALKGKYLTAYLLTLKNRNCSQFAEECQKRPYSVNQFTDLVYIYFCDETKYSEMCPSEDHINDIPSSLSLQEPCTQVTMYDSTQNLKRGEFHEIVEVFLPFCEFIWCGINNSTLAKYRTFPWNCMSSRCKASIIVDMVITLILSLLVTFANATVLAVHFYNPKMRNSQGLFKMSLAVADLITGVILFPTFVSTVEKLVWEEVDHSALVVHRHYTENTTFLENKGGSYQQKLTVTYFNFVGIFSAISIAVSGYTLLMASIDRCLAMRNPFYYMRHNSKTIALWMLLGVWIVSIAFALLPLILSDLDYSLDASLLVTLAGKHAIIIYIVAFMMPLTALWIVTLCTYILFKKHITLSKNLKRKNSSAETGLTKTLTLMVAAFTFSILPIAILLMVSFFLSDIYYDNRYLRPNTPTGAIAYNGAKFIAVRILLCNSFWNVLIYSVRDKRFLVAVKELFFKTKNRIFLVCKCGTSNTHPVKKEKEQNARTVTTEF